MVHGGEGQGRGDKEWNGGSDGGNGALEKDGTGELGWAGRLALSDEGVRVEVQGGRRKVQGGGRTGARVGRNLLQDGILLAQCGRLVVLDGRLVLLDGKRWVLDDKGLVLDGKPGLAHCILGGRSAVRLRTRLWRGNHRRQLGRSRSEDVDRVLFWGRLITMITKITMITMVMVENHQNHQEVTIGNHDIMVFKPSKIISVVLKGNLSVGVMIVITIRIMMVII